ncbi:hypothetical protein VNO80_08183 [Phaseolus coccineus]|uniref:Uncharacterized protein n=1 Tax=Phaseolus coccineus TaxID=3886 RepID=A0AAN9NKL9_PHACN
MKWRETRFWPTNHSLFTVHTNKQLLRPRSAVARAATPLKQGLVCCWFCEIFVKQFPIYLLLSLPFISFLLFAQKRNKMRQ